jgi:hypothetical protein
MKYNYLFGFYLIGNVAIGVNTTTEESSAYVNSKWLINTHIGK